MHQVKQQTDKRDEALVKTGPGIAKFQGFCVAIGNG